MDLSKTDTREYILRPEAAEGWWYMYELTRDDKYVLLAIVVFPVTIHFNKLCLACARPNFTIVFQTTLLGSSCRYREWGWKTFLNFEKYLKVDHGYASLRDVRDPRRGKVG